MLRYYSTSVFVCVAPCGFIYRRSFGVPPSSDRTNIVSGNYYCVHRIDNHMRRPALADQALVPRAGPVGPCMQAVAVLRKDGLVS
mmetsp:Transcript_9679/g.35460  ORF Transcript_9679/g.35460 Transcript_9679/m.35460 type:complete len:85 (-) Transcript_9679:972-1226(-)